MRKYIFIALVAFMVVGLVACGGGAGSGGTTDNGGVVDVTKYPGSIDYSQGGKKIEEVLTSADGIVFKGTTAGWLEIAKIKIVADGKDVADTEYTVDYKTGLVTFKNKNEAKEVKATYVIDENPAAGLLITNTPPENKEPFIQPVVKEELIGEMRIPPNPTETWTCFDATYVDDKSIKFKTVQGQDYALQSMDVTGDLFQHWTETPRTKETYMKGIMHTFQYDNPELKFWVWFELDKEIDWGKFDKFNKTLDARYKGYQDFKIVDKGEYKTTLCDAKGTWILYTFKKNGVEWKGRELFYGMRGDRLGETEFGPGKGIHLQAEGPAAVYDEAWEKGNLLYMFQEVMITAPTPTTAQ